MRRLEDIALRRLEDIVLYTATLERGRISSQNENIMFDAHIATREKGRRRESRAGARAITRNLTAFHAHEKGVGFHHKTKI
jgi:hypothetical protein